MLGANSVELVVGSKRSLARKGPNGQQQRVVR